MFKTLAVSRRGVMAIGLVRDDSTQCMNRGDREIDYQVEVQCDPELLTPEGFVIERSKISRYFDSKWGGIVAKLPSCEVMAKTAAVELAALVGPGAREVLVNIGGVVAVWVKD